MRPPRREVSETAVRWRTAACRARARPDGRTRALVARRTDSRDEPARDGRNDDDLRSVCTRILDKLFPSGLYVHPPSAVNERPHDPQPRLLSWVSHLDEDPVPEGVDRDDRDGRCVLLGGPDGASLLWDLSSGKLRERLPAPPVRSGKASVRGADFAFDGRELSFQVEEGNHPLGAR